MRDPFDWVRLLAAIVAVLVIIGCSVIGWVVRNARKWGCVSLILMGIAVTGGNLSRLGQAPTVWTVFGLAGMGAGLIYVAKVMGEPDWRDKYRPIRK